MTEDTERMRPTPSVPAACFLALLLLLSTTAILIHDTMVCLPRGSGIWNPRPLPVFLSLIAPTEWGVRLEEGSADEGPTERIESPWNAYRSGHWATATLLSLAVPWLWLKVLAMCGLWNLL